MNTIYYNAKLRTGQQKLHWPARDLTEQTLFNSI